MDYILDQEISWKAKGILAFLLQYPDVHVKDIVAQATDGRNGVMTGINELEARGYLQKIQERSRGRFGRFTYEVRENLEDDF